MKGTYLKEISVSFKLPCKTNPAITKDFISELIKKLDMDLVFAKTILLPPSFEILCCIKQSHIIFSYWEEINFVKMSIFSCCNYEIEAVVNLIKSYFNIEKVKVDLVKDCSIFNEVKELE